MTLFDLLNPTFWRTRINHLPMEKFLWLIFFFSDEWNLGMKFGDIWVSKLNYKGRKTEVRSPKSEAGRPKSEVGSQKSQDNAQRSTLSVSLLSWIDYVLRSTI